ncbi:Ig-like domain-containing protein [Cohnella mopanensis]|uniref:Ig-like domain-containing protein n=1 Tax=Cohnella mopanensis TaxID=2911966 RepID=UPI001EF7FDBD|nr:Ig-like domain-containing protein [Cohnella mopanensis]
MRKTIAGMLVWILIVSMPITVFGASNLSTEQKYEVLKQKNIFTGFADGSSRLYDPMSREQLAAVLSRLLELPSQSSTPGYDDVLRTRWSYPDVQKVTRAGLMNGTKKRIFSPGDNVTVEQLAAIFTRSYGGAGGGVTPVTGEVSKWARGAVSQALDRKLIPQLSDYTVDATRGLLVDAAYAIYEDTHVEPLRIRSVEQISNQSVKVNLQQWMNPSEGVVDKSRFILSDAYGNNRTVYQAILSQDGMSIVLWTDRQTGGTFHTLSVDGTNWNYMSASDDTTKPQVISQPVKVANRTYEITFSEQVEANSATNSSNYQFNNGLKMTTLQLSSDQRKVTFTTSDQSDGKSYQLTIRNVKDLAGNVMDSRNDLYIQGNNDSSKPKITSVNINANATLTVKFNEKIKPEYAVLNDRYSIDKGVYVIQALIDNDGKTVTLRTSAQLDATVYQLTVANIPDLNGNIMDTSTGWMFGGIANPEKPVQLLSLRAIDQNTVEVAFNRSLSGNDLKNIKLTIVKDNGNDVSMKDWVAFVKPKSGTDNTYVFQYRTKASNPELFRAGHVYAGKVTGVAGLVTANDADKLPFAGTDIGNPVPFVTQVAVLDRYTVKVLFSEPVTNVSKSAFFIREKDGNAIEIGDDQLHDTGKVVYEVVLKLRDELQANKNYGMTFRPDTITDEAKWNGLKTKEDDQPFVVYFNT